MDEKMDERMDEKVEEQPLLPVTVLSGFLVSWKEMFLLSPYPPRPFCSTQLTPLVSPTSFLSPHNQTPYHPN